jgi:hypothetical protein
VTPEQIDAVGFEPAHLRLIQGLASTKAEDIADEVRKDGPQAPGPPTPLEELTTVVAHALGSVGTNLTSLSSNLGIPQLPFQLDPSRQEAAQIATRLIQGQFGSYGNLRDVINALLKFSVPAEAIKNLMRWMAPYWLTPEASGRFSAVVQEFWENQKGGLAAVGGKHLMTYTSSMLVDRVRPYAYQTRVAQIELGSDRNDADYYTGQICEWVRNHISKSLYSGDDAQILKQLQADLPWLFVPIAPVDAETLNSLRQRFPTVVFLIWTTPVGPSEGDIISLIPDIDTTREETERQFWRAAVLAANLPPM